MNKFQWHLSLQDRKEALESELAAVNKAIRDKTQAECHHRWTKYHEILGGRVRMCVKCEKLESV